MGVYRQATQEPSQDCEGYGEGEGGDEGKEEVRGWLLGVCCYFRRGKSEAACVYLHHVVALSGA